MKIYTSYFYQIRNFKQNMIPVSTALSDPEWFKPPTGKEYYIDKRGIICGLRYEPLIVQRYGTCSCPCENKNILKGNCFTMQEYRQLLETIDFDKMMKAFEYCLNIYVVKENIYRSISMNMEQSAKNWNIQSKKLESLFKEIYL